MSRIRRNLKLPVHASTRGFLFPSRPPNSKKKAFADWRPDSALIGLTEPSKKKNVKHPRKKLKRAEPKAVGSSGLIPMPKSVDSIEPLSTRDQVLSIHPEEKTPSRHDSIQDPIHFEEYQYTTGSKDGPTSNLSQKLSSRVLTERIKNLTVLSQLSKEHHNFQALPQINQVLAPQQLLLRSKEENNFTETERNPPSIMQYDERSDVGRCNKSSFANDVLSNLQTESVLLNEKVSDLGGGNTSKHLEESSYPVCIPDSTFKSPDCGPQFSTPELFAPLRQPKDPAETKRAKNSRTEVKDSARLRTSISIKAPSRNPQQAGNQAWHVIFTNSEGIRVDIQEDILDNSSQGSLRLPRRRMPGEPNLDSHRPHVEGIHSDHSDTIFV